jgi:lipoprotein-anchoring transpeptidase ErfK/SrfK
MSPRRLRSHRLLAVLLVGVLAFVAAGCGSDDRPEVSQDTVASTTAPSTSTTADPNLVTVATTPESTYDVYTAPDAATPDHQVTAPEGEGVPLTFLVREQQGDWLHVDLPERPNGATGWIKKDGVTLQTHDFHITVNLGEFNIKVYRGDEVILDAPIGVAKDNTPSPGGEYYTTSLLQPPDPNSVYGTYAYGLSAFSEVYESFSGGPGQLGIHGTNEDDTIGTQVSHGCIRLHNSDIEQLVPVLPVGVPVTINP